MSRYVKFISALLGSIATWGYTASATDGISSVEWFGLLGVLGTALAVFQFPNEPAPQDGAEKGHVNLLLLGVVLLVILLLCLLFNLRLVRGH